MKKILIFTSFVVALLSTSCDKKEEFEQVNSSTVDLAGEWYVTYYIDGVAQSSASKLLTYNTANDDGNELWVDDGENFWHFKAKAKVGTGDLTFGNNEELDNDYYSSKVIIQNGKIIEKASLQPSGVMADSIYFEVLFNDDGHYDINDDWVEVPYEFTYQCIGFRKTGFLEDEPH